MDWIKNLNHKSVNRLAHATTRKPRASVGNVLLFLLLLQQVNQPLWADSNVPEWRYSVRRGDTLIQLGKRYLVNPNDWPILQKLNQITDPYRIPIASIVRMPLALLKQTPAAVEVIATTGDCYLLESNQSKKRLVVGQQLKVGALLHTADKSRLSLRFADGSIVNMQPDSNLHLDTLSLYANGAMVDTALRLQQGHVDVKANPAHVQGYRMQIFTPTAVAAVRGTEFRLTTETHQLRQETLDGSVAVSVGGNDVLVNKGYGTVSIDGHAPQTPVPLLGAPNLHNLPAKLMANPVIFNITTQPQAVAWIGKIYQDASLHNVVAEAVSNNGQLNFGDMIDGQYVLQVRAKDSNGLEGYDSIQSFTLKVQLLAPHIISPVNNVVVREAQPRLMWSAVATATSYQIELAKDTEFKDLVPIEQVASNQIVPKQALLPGPYFLRIASVKHGDVGPYSAVNSFSYKPIPPAPDISQLITRVKNNRVFVEMVNPPDGLNYQASLDNEQNQQMNVWHALNLGGHFDFLLREYGKQTLRVRLVDADGVAGPEATTIFYAWSQW